MNRLRVLLVADTHLGFDHTYAPRVERRRRGPDFFRCFRTALEPALRGEVDMVVHGGDLFFRSKIPERLVWDAFQPIFEVAAKGIPVFVVPGNHERGNIPHGLLALHRNVHIFDRPRTFTFDLGGTTIALSGFPSVREGIRDTFLPTLEATGWREIPAGLLLLCMHQSLEGAQVHHYTFRHGPDVIPLSVIPGDFRAVLSGHIHRAQILTHDLTGRPAPVPVYYPGSVERTAFVERFEEKGCYRLDIPVGSGEIESEFLPLPARPMAVIELGPKPDGAEFRRRVLALKPDTVVQVRIGETGFPDFLRAEQLRRWLPPEMNLEISAPKLVAKIPGSGSIGPR